jgi:hypothetical protein
VGAAVRVAADIAAADIAAVTKNKTVSATRAIAWLRSAFLTPVACCNR